MRIKSFVWINWLVGSVETQSGHEVDVGDALLIVSTTELGKFFLL